MSLRFCSLASGSRGNCLYLSSENTTVIIDAGISLKRIEQGLGKFGGSKINLLITHTHSDHVSGLASFVRKYSPSVYCFGGCYDKVKDIVMGGAEVTAFDGDFYLGDITVSPFRVSHDVPCVGYSFYNGGRKLSVMTDLGVFTQSQAKQIEGSDALFIESNYDEDILKRTDKYSQALKNRIFSRYGHLSNSDSAKASLFAAESGCGAIMLGHLSQENNTPELALETTRKALNEAGYAIPVSVALQDRLSSVMEVT